MLPLFQEPFLHIHPCQEIQSGKRLVQQQHIRPGKEGAGKGHPLLHATGKVFGVFLPVIQKPHLFQHFPAAQFLFLFFHACQFHGQADILFDGPPGKQQVLLGHKGTILLQLPNRPAIHGNFPLLQLFQPVDKAENRTFPTAGSPDDGDKIPLFHGKGKISHHGGFVPLVLECHIFKCQQSFFISFQESTQRKRSAKGFLRFSQEKAPSNRKRL